MCRSTGGLLRRIGIAVATMLVLAGLGLVRAHPAAAQTYLACGNGAVSYPQPTGIHSCPSLTDAILAAEGHPGRDTITLLPGTYCPIDLEGNLYDSITFVGAGWAGIDTSGGSVSFSGYEAELTTFKYDPLFCGGLPSSNAAIKLNAFVYSPGFTFENLTVDATGLNYGFYAPASDADLRIRDVIVKGAAQAGVYWQSDTSSYSMDLANSAIVHNTGVGVHLGGYGSIYASTIADNDTGVFLYAYASLGSDTIARNHYGVDAQCCQLQAVDDVVVDNVSSRGLSSDCIRISDWEYPAANSWNNLYDDTTCNTYGGVPDFVDATVGVSDIQDNGGPTPSILPPAAAYARGQGPCGLNGVDQRELLAGNPPCDLGSLQRAAGSAVAASVGDADLGTVPSGSPSQGAAHFYASGAGLVGVRSVSVTGRGWSVADDGCTRVALTKSGVNSCDVTVAVSPTAGGTWSGTIIVSTTAGDFTGNLTAHALAPPTITGFLPRNGEIGTTVTVNGTGFAGATHVALNGVAATFSVASATVLTFTVPVGASTGPVSVVAPSGAGTSAMSFVVTAQRPTVRSFRPVEGRIGDTISIAGAHLTGASIVSFNGVHAVTFSVDTDTTITAVVPAGATTGPVSVTTAGGTAASTAVFAVLPAVAPTPAITSFTPASGIRGVKVIIRGSGFTGATSVTFNGTSAIFTVLDDRTIRAVVPFGATSGHIEVTTPAGTATSAGTFTI